MPLYQILNCLGSGWRVRRSFCEKKKCMSAANKACQGSRFLRERRNSCVVAAYLSGIEKALFKHDISTGCTQALKVAVVRQAQESASLGIGGVVSVCVCERERE